MKNGFTRPWILNFSQHRSPISVRRYGIIILRSQGLTPRRYNKRKRGKKGGVRQRLRRQLHNNRIPLPSIILANVQSLRNKIDGLHGHVTHLREYRDACLLGFTETWISASDSDASLDLTGFGAPIRLDRDSEVTHKKQGGGVCLYINRRWCNN